MSTQISNRIKAIAEQIKYGTLADIGTDHAFIPIYACISGRIRMAVAADNNPGPLENARGNILAYGLSGSIKCRLSDGLESILPGEAESCSICGMGGRLISEILNKSTRTTASFSQLVLQPQRDLELVRKTVHQAGFRIQDERALYDGGKYYFVISCERGADVPYSEADYMLGKILIEKGGRVFMDFLEGEIIKTDRILSGALASTGMDELVRRERVMREVYKCL